MNAPSGCPSCMGETCPFEPCRNADARRIKELEAEVARLKSAAKPAWPRTNESVFFLGGDGIIRHGYYHSPPGPGDYLSQGNLFRTWAEAGLESRRRVVMQKLRVLAAESGLINSARWFSLCAAPGCWHCSSYEYPSPGQIQFATQAGVSNAIKLLGTELEVLRPGAK